MPYLNSLAQRYGQATNYSDVAHPSLPNYLAIFGGSSFNDPQDCFPSAQCSYPAPSVFGQVGAAGGTVRSYEESMPSPCDLSNSGNYDVNHNPWVYFPAESKLCKQADVPAGSPSAGALAADVRAGTLPTVGLLTPNLMHDAHDGTLAQADAYLRSWIPVIMAGPGWKSGHLAIVVTFDEGVTTEQVPFVVLAPGLHGVTIRRALNHYALTRLMDQIGGVSPLNERTAAQLDALTRALEATEPGRYLVRYGAKHARPKIEEAVDTLAADGVDQLRELLTRLEDVLSERQRGGGRP